MVRANLSHESATRADNQPAGFTSILQHAATRSYETLIFAATSSANIGTSRPGSICLLHDTRRRHLGLTAADAVELRDDDDPVGPSCVDLRVLSIAPAPHQHKPTRRFLLLDQLAEIVGGHPCILENLRQEATLHNTLASKIEYATEFHKDASS
jgi:hypothetical protein